MKGKKKVSIWELYLTKEIGIEFKSCLYFFAILFFYCVFRVIKASMVAEIIHMTEMILTCYVIGYLQVYIFWNFDEADEFKGKEFAGMMICTAIYCALAYLFSWFEKSIMAELIFAAYLILMYVSVFFIYKSKRIIDDKILNDDLRIFQSKHKE